VLLAGCTTFLYALEKQMPFSIACATGFLVVLFLVFSGTTSPPPGFAGEVFVITGVLLLFFLSSIVRLEVTPPDDGSFKLDTTGTIVTERAWGKRRVVVVKTDEGTFLCKLPATKVFREGDQARITGNLHFFKPNLSSDGFDEDTYWRARGVLGVVRQVEISKCGFSTFGFPAWRSFLKERILLRLPKLTRAYVLAAWLGKRDPDLADLHRQWGTSHLLAISGLHVGIVALGLKRIFRRGVLVPSFFMWAYVVIAGGAASAIRAALMFQLAFAGNLLGRPVRAVNAVPAAAVLILFWRPWWFWDLGWRLSVVAALVLGSLAGTRDNRFLWAAPVLVWYMTGAFIARAFEEVPLVGLIMNIFAVPFFSVFLPVLSVAALPVLAGVPGASFAVYIAEGMLRFYHYCAQSIAMVISFKAGVEFFPAVAVAAILLFIILKACGMKGWSPVLAAICAAVFGGVLL
jgi:competence protein ComEC